MAKILNLYCGIGGNRKLWGEAHDITSVELDEEVAAIYQGLFPSDSVVVGDAHEYLVNHLLDGWDFIWASPPCPSHSRINTDGNHPPRYPEMSLYQEIIILKNNWYKGQWVVENVIPYYDPLIPPTVEISRHLFWCNFSVNKAIFSKEKPISLQTGTNGRYGFNLKDVSAKIDKRKTLRNLVDPEIGLYFLNRALSINDSKNYEQLALLV